MIPRADGIRFPLVPPVSSRELRVLPAEVQLRLNEEGRLRVPVSMGELWERERGGFKTESFLTIPV